MVTDRKRRLPARGGVDAADRSSASLYEALGGATAVRTLVHCFFNEVARLPPSTGVRALLAPRAHRLAPRLFEFLSGWLGGPPLYTQRHGLPNLRARHRDYAIGSAERDQWLQCMQRAIVQSGVPVEQRERLNSAFWQVANSLRNRDEPSA
jgi:hemoglobin